MELRWKYFYLNLKEYYLSLLNVKGVLKSEDMKVFNVILIFIIKCFKDLLIIRCLS